MEKTEFMLSDLFKKHINGKIERAKEILKDRVNKALNTGCGLYYTDRLCVVIQMPTGILVDDVILDEITRYARTYNEEAHDGAILYTISAARKAVREDREGNREEIDSAADIEVYCSHVPGKQQFDEMWSNIYNFVPGNANTTTLYYNKNKRNAFGNLVKLIKQSHARISKKHPEKNVFMAISEGSSSPFHPMLKDDSRLGIIQIRYITYVNDENTVTIED